MGHVPVAWQGAAGHRGPIALTSGSRLQEGSFIICSPDSTASPETPVPIWPISMQTDLINFYLEAGFLDFMPLLAVITIPSSALQQNFSKELFM